MNIGFYILGKKGYVALCEFVKYFGSDSVAFVVAARDGSIENDWYSEIIKMNHANGLNSFTRNEFNNDSLPNSDFNFAIGWRWLIKEPANLVVFHDSLLPKYRGFSPLVNMLIDGCDEIGVTALIASDEYDKGAIIYQSRKKITYPLKISDAIEKIIPLYTELAIKIAEDIKSDGDLNVFPQDESLASYSLWRDETDYFVNWLENSHKIQRLVDAVGSPYRGALTFLNGKIVRLLKVEPLDDVIVENRVSSIGKVIFSKDDNLVVICAEGLLKVTEIRSYEDHALVEKVPFRSRFENRK